MGIFHLLLSVNRFSADFEGMLEIIILALFIGGLSQMMNDAGGLKFISEKITSRIKGRNSLLSWE